MGELANDIINGFMCSWCGICFREEHGYPVVCHSCGKGIKEKELLEKHGVQKAIYKEI